MNKWILLAFILIIGGATYESYAALYSFSESPLSLSWTTVTNAVVLDTNKDGIIDTAYSASTLSSNTITFTKIFGSGTSPIVKTFSAPGSPSVKLGVFNNQTITVAISGSQASCRPYMHFMNINTGAVNTLSTTTGGTDNEPCFISPNYTYIPSTNSFMYFTYYAGASSSNQCFYNIERNSTIVTSNSVNDNCAGGASAVVNYFGIDPSWNTNVYNYDLTTSANSVLNGNAGFVFNNTATDTIKQLYLNNTVNFFDKNATHFIYGMQIDNYKNSFTQQNEPTWNTFLQTLLPTSVASDEKSYYLHYKILKNGLTTDPTVIKIKIGGSDYIGLLDPTSSSLFYAPIPDLSSYAFQSYMIDNYPSEILTNPASTQLPTQPSTIITPVSSYDVNAHGIIGLISGHYLTPQDIDRIFNAGFQNSLNIIPAHIKPVVGNTAVSVLIKNLPTDPIIKVENPDASAFGNDFRWGDKEPTADDTFTIDIPTNHCFEIYIADGSFITPTWEPLGSLCASGTMPKTVTYTQNLSFVFWSLPWGFDSNYDQPSQNLVTKVRHDTIPFTYTVRIFNSTNSLAYEQTYIANSTTLDLQTANVTDISKPAILKIYDDTDTPRYVTTLGYPSYLSSVVPFFDQYFSIDGFNILFLIPIVFGAMFTRNTVGIGSVLTVACVATLIWFGVISIPEPYIYLMIFISILGLVAYRYYY